MAQGHLSSHEYRFEVTCFTSRDGTWRIDLRVSEDWGSDFVRVPLRSGTAGEYLSLNQREELVAVVRAHLERGIDHIIAPF